MTKRPPLLTEHGRNKRVTLCGTNLSMSDLARATGYGVAHVSKVFCRRGRPSETALAAFAEALGLSPATLDTMLKEEK